jgi:hypothetical protein
MDVLLAASGNFARWIFITPVDYTGSIHLLISKMRSEKCWNSACIVDFQS